MTREVIVLDNNVLSGAYEAGWFDSLSFWTDDALLAVPKRVWSEEFESTHDGVDGAPTWMTVQKADLDALDVRAQGQLSVQDWCCVALVESTSGRLVTNDGALYARVEARGGTAVWGTKFLKRTFERCGIRVEAFEEGVERYVEDAYLPESVASAIRSAEKD
ncbi:hypothetical protein [Haloarchaeobius baliensis]|uniref:hypothetical protein n=1 Tax=Haloarchaeobius baliensis TaxID=1670458 RepID=UPI003F88486A